MTVSTTVEIPEEGLRGKGGTENVYRLVGIAWTQNKASDSRRFMSGKGSLLPPKSVETTPSSL